MVLARSSRRLAHIGKILLWRTVIHIHRDGTADGAASGRQTSAFKGDVGGTLTTPVIELAAGENSGTVGVILTNHVGLCSTYIRLILTLRVMVKE